MRYKDYRLRNLNSEASFFSNIIYVTSNLYYIFNAVSLLLSSPQYAGQKQVGCDSEVT